MITYTLKIVQIVRETEDTSTIFFKQPGLKKIKYLAGQYITVVVNVNGRKYKRPYSLSSSPRIDSTINITVKKLLHGVVSNHLVDVVKEGDMLEVIEPMGNFLYDVDMHHNKAVFLWGAGSGITPLMSILKTALVNNSQQINLFYCNKTTQHTIFFNQLQQLQQNNKQKLGLNFFYTEEQIAQANFGRINAYDVEKALSGLDVANTLHYICGPNGLKETVKTALLENGVQLTQIFFEDFEHIINEVELKDVQTRFVTLINNSNKNSIEVIRGKSILEAALDTRLDLPYSCQTGTCTLCKATLVSGEVKKIGNEKMDHELSENERLLCCSYPLTNNIIFEIN
ncbi:iron-sulfur cluster-binding domain-containing protein [Mucilaginibacter sp. dw_454]|uniref:FAD-binding oxidoreductase n=1 Tax=Mucilaginibacter sp. dw_454 TaxID=2720079 RepID=UPI001BD485F4